MLTRGVPVIMRILLIKPYWPYPYGKGEHTYNRIWPPLSLANCAAILEREGHNVRILDAHALRLKPSKITAHVGRFDQIFITSSSLDRWQCPNIDISTFLETARNLRALTEEIYVTGYHGTVEPESILKQTGVKAVIRGAPEYVVAAIARQTQLEQIQGLTFVRNGEVVSTPDQTVHDMKHFSVPAYHLLDMKKYSYEILGDRFALFEIGRGCNFGCKFCNKIMYAPKLRTKSKEQVREELRVAIEHNGVKTGYFIDLEFCAYKGHVADMCDFLIEQGYDFKWCCQTRADSVDKEILVKMKKAGCALIHVGVESGLQKYLDLSGKGITEEKLVEGVRLCHNAGIKTLAFYMFGHRGETSQDRIKIFRFAKKLNTHFASFHKVYPYLQSDMYAQNINDSEELDRAVRWAFVRYYLCFKSLKRENIFVLMRSLKLFLGRLVTL